MSSGSEYRSSTSLSLLGRVRENDQDAWRRLVYLYGPLVYRWCGRAGLREEDAADVVQEVFQAVATSIARYQRRSATDSFRGWLWTITRRRVADYYRRRPSPAAVGGEQGLEALANLPEVVPDETDADAVELVHRALSGVRPDFAEHTWQAFWRTAIERRSAAEVAADLGLSVDSVYQAKSRVLRRVREELAGLSDFPG